MPLIQKDCIASGSNLPGHLEERAPFKGGKAHIGQKYIEQSPNLFYVVIYFKIFFMSLLTIPVNVAKRLETIQCRFLWGDIEGT